MLKSHNSFYDDDDDQFPTRINSLLASFDYIQKIQHVASIYWGITRTQVARSAIVPCLTLLLQLLFGITTG